MHANCIPYNSKTIVTKRSLIRNRAIAYILIFACLISCIVQTDASIDPTGPTPEADPNVALEGQCVVVCDAEPVAVKAARIQDREINAAGQNPATKLWENMRCSCGDIGTTFCRNQKVAFSAIRGTSLTTPEIQPILLFDYVILNDGNGFEVSTGSFRAPVTGVYSFSFQIFRMSNPDTLNVHLKVWHFISCGYSERGVLCQMYLASVVL